MKFKTTAKAVKEGYYNIRSAGYCDLCFLLNYKIPVAYTSGVYGWNFDVYALDGLTICTGYRGMPGERANKIREYNEKARKIVDNWEIPNDEKKKMVDKLLEEFINENKE